MRSPRPLPPLLAVILIFAQHVAAPAAPVMFITQTPISADFANIVSVFANHRGQAWNAPRGGDLYIRYDDGTLRNLTAEAGYGATVENEITVRDPSIHWDGTKALFSMAIGGTTQNDYSATYFQIYEVTGLGQGETVTMTKLPQPDFNNITPLYDSADRIVFTSDRPRNGDRRLYPQLDEYESTPTNTGIWRMNADGTGVVLLDHSPSGDFSPIIDSFGRIIFSRWDHLQRDQQADGDIEDLIDERETDLGTITYDSEEADTFHELAPGDEVFPEARYLYPNGDNTPHPVWNADYVEGERDHRFNQFLPWMMNQDGTELETLNHIGRHELFTYIQSARSGLPDFFRNDDEDRIRAFLSPVEDPTRPGYYYGIDAPEFQSHAAGQIVLIVSPPSANADDIRGEYITRRETAFVVPEGGIPGPNNIGLFRDPMARSDGTLWAAHSGSPFLDRATATDPGAPEPYPISSRYDFAIRRMVPEATSRSSGSRGPTEPAYMVPGERLVPGGIVETVAYFDNNRYRPVAYNGPMWELQPVEVVARTRPPAPTTPIPEIELDIIKAELGGDEGVNELRQYLIDNELALVVSRDVTIRADKQQDYNLKIAWSDHQHTEPDETPKEVGWMQFFEGQQVRGYQNIQEGARRILARHMRPGINPPVAGRPAGGVRLGGDGSMAAFVPARRAMSWQMTEPDGTPSVRERYWLTFQPGEIRSCTNCHGLNRTDVFGGPKPTNDPQAFIDLLRWWRDGGRPDSTGWIMF